MPLRQTHVGPGLGSKGWPHHQLWLHTFLAAGWALVTQQASASEALTMTMLCLQPSCPPRQHPRGAGASPGAVPLGRGPESPGARAAVISPHLCCPSWGVPGCSRGEARGCRCSHLGLLRILHTTGFNEITGLFLFPLYCCYKPLFLPNS